MTKYTDFTLKKIGQSERIKLEEENNFQRFESEWDKYIHDNEHFMIIHPHDAKKYFKHKKPKGHEENTYCFDITLYNYFAKLMGIKVPINNSAFGLGRKPPTARVIVNSKVNRGTIKMQHHLMAALKMEDFDDKKVRFAITVHKTFEFTELAVLGLEEK